jgi:hypothetical protein
MRIGPALEDPGFDPAVAVLGRDDQTCRRLCQERLRLPWARLTSRRRR